jgi:hypothetical protein
MTFQQLQHAIRAACEVAGDNELWVFGSQAILSVYPEAPESLRTSIEVDVQPKNLPERTIYIDGALGELSLFHQTHGFYVHGVSIDTARLPEGWKKRVVRVVDEIRTKGMTGLCVEVHDLAASKIVAFREKDRDFIRTLIIEDLIEHELLAERIRLLPVETDIIEHRLRWLSLTVNELSQPFD